MSDLLKKSLGQRVRAARETCGISQEEVARKVGRTVESISNLERGKTLPGLETLQDIAAAVGIRLSVLLDEPSTGASAQRLAQKISLLLPLVHCPMWMPNWLWRLSNY